eukprot:gene37465-18834_t
MRVQRWRARVGAATARRRERRCRRRREEEEERERGSAQRSRIEGEEMAARGQLLLAMWSEPPPRTKSACPAVVAILLAVVVGSGACSRGVVGRARDLAAAERGQRHTLTPSGAHTCARKGAAARRNPAPRAFFYGRTEPPPPTAAPSVVELMQRRQQGRTVPMDEDEVRPYTVPMDEDEVSLLGIRVGEAPKPGPSDGGLDVTQCQCVFGVDDASACICREAV